MTTQQQQGPSVADLYAKIGLLSVENDLLRQYLAEAHARNAELEADGPEPEVSP